MIRSDHINDINVAIKTSTQYGPISIKETTCTINGEGVAKWRSEGLRNGSPEFDSRSASFSGDQNSKYFTT